MYKTGWNHDIYIADVHSLIRLLCKSVAAQIHWSVGETSELKQSEM